RFESAKAMREAIEAAQRPSDADAVGVFLSSLWPVGDPERVAMESLAAGRAEESSEPALESIISQGYEVPAGAVSTPRPALNPYPLSEVVHTMAPLPLASPVPRLGPEPKSALTVPESPSATIPMAT